MMRKGVCNPSFLLRKSWAAERPSLWGSVWPRRIQKLPERKPSKELWKICRCPNRRCFAEENGHENKNMKSGKWGESTSLLHSRFYVDFFLGEMPFQFRHTLVVRMATENWYQGGFIIPFARWSGMRKLLMHTESLKRMWRRFQGGKKRFRSSFCMFLLSAG